MHIREEDIRRRRTPRHSPPPRSAPDQRVQHGLQTRGAGFLARWDVRTATCGPTRCVRVSICVSNMTTQVLIHIICGMKLSKNDQQEPTNTIDLIATKNNRQ